MQERMMNEHDLLLYWLSSRHEKIVSKAVVTRSCESLAKSLDKGYGDNKQPSLLRYRYFYPLLHLGHIEFEDYKHWKIIPSTVLWVSSNGKDGQAIISGARNSLLKKQLIEKFNNKIEITPQIHGPEKWAFLGSFDEAQNMADKIKGHLFFERSIDVLKLLPSLQKAVREMPIDENAQYNNDTWYFFNPKEPRNNNWQKKKNCKKTHGLCRNKEKPPYKLFYKLKNGNVHNISFKKPEHNWIARWDIISKEGNPNLCFKESDKTLHISPNYYLPILLERCLCMSSGLLPEKMQESKIYKNISLKKAKEISRILNIKLKII